MDTTCVEANIHFPVDWVLLRDATRTLMKATALIRRHGLKCRMRDPEQFLREMNQRCIAMAQAGKAADSNRAPQAGVASDERLDARGPRARAASPASCSTRTGRKRTGRARRPSRCSRRIDGVLAQLPQAVKQAMKRIIGERLVPNADKILSLYDGDLHVIVRGKAGAAWSLATRC